MKKSRSKTLVVVTGPTAIGKTALAIELARHYQTEIVSADARQFFREMKIGTSMPSDEELAAIRHHFIGHLSVADYYNVSMYEQQALALLDKLFRKHDHVVLAGGSGLYIDALIYGIDSLPEADPEIRTKVKRFYMQNGLPGIRSWLRNVDPVYYNRVDLANPNRMMRGLEVYLQTGIPYSEHLSRPSLTRPFNIKMIVLNRDRQELFSMINERVDRMVMAGLIEEALACYPFRYTNALNTVGYKEIFAWLSNAWPLHTAIGKIKTNTRRYARRQLTWFKRYEEARWFHPAEAQAVRQFIEGD
jgi:tRNA dimethylallyltransferase